MRKISKPEPNKETPKKEKASRHEHPKKEVPKEKLKEEVVEDKCSFRRRWKSSTRRSASIISIYRW